MLIRRLAVASTLLLSACAALAANDTQPAAAPTIARPDILPMLEKCADKQLELMNGKTPIDWTAATFEIALARLSHISSKPEYQAAEEKIADAHKWMVNGGRGGRRFHADDQAVGQMYIDLAVTKNDPKLLDPLIAEETSMIDQINKYDANVQNPGLNGGAAKREIITWWWCDALFMNPAVFVRLAAVTGDQKFLAAMDKAYDECTTLLYDNDAHLYYRDNTFVGVPTSNGKKNFWSRGDGWVMAGLANMIPYLPKDWPQRDKYVNRFKDMAAALAAVQKPDGLWAPSLLDPQNPNYEETSGSAFYTYALAWGINNNILDKATYQPVVEKGWAAVVAKLRPDGQLGFVQPIGYQAEKGSPITADNTQYYGNGAFILAGTEVMKLAPAK